MKHLFLGVFLFLLMGAACQKAPENTTEQQTTTNTVQNSIETTETILPTPTPPTNTASDRMTLTVDEVRNHSSESDCWLIINGAVYNVTSYIPIHPGGAQEISSLCGQDATTAFATQGGEGQLSNDADSDLTSLIIGKLGDSIKR